MTEHAASLSVEVLPGEALPPGASWDRHGTILSLFSEQPTAPSSLSVRRGELVNDTAAGWLVDSDYATTRLPTSKAMLTSDRTGLLRERVAAVGLDHLAGLRELAQ
jgi:hypothetical protein